MISPACGALPSSKKSVPWGFFLLVKAPLQAPDQRWATTGETGKPSLARVMAGCKISIKEIWKKIKT